MSYYRPPEKPLSWLRRRAHRHGVARGLSRMSSSERGLLEERVETALPWQRLALYAARHHGMQVVAVEQYGLLRRRWLLKPIGERCVRR